MSLKFGKYAGQDVRDVPREYLDWLATQMRASLVTIDEEIQRRDELEAMNLLMAERVIQAGYRALAKEMHPDTGNGNTAQMTELNLTVEALRKTVKK